MLRVQAINLTIIIFTILYLSKVAQLNEDQEYHPEAGEYELEEVDLESLKWSVVDDAEEIKRVHFVANYLFPGVKRHTGAFRDDFMEVMNIRNMFAKDVYWKFDMVCSFIDLIYYCIIF